MFNFKSLIWRYCYTIKANDMLYPSVSIKILIKILPPWSLNIDISLNIMFQHQTRPVKSNVSFNYSKEKKKAVPEASRNSEPKITIIFILNYLVLYVLQPMKDHRNMKQLCFMFLQYIQPRPTVVCSWVVGTPLWYYSRPWFYTQPSGRLFWLNFHGLFRQILGKRLKVGHYRELSHPIQFTFLKDFILVALSSKGLSFNSPISQATIHHGLPTVCPQERVFGQFLHLKIYCTEWSKSYATHYWHMW
jgi:hypothetical protein